MQTAFHFFSITAGRRSAIRSKINAQKGLSLSLGDERTRDLRWALWAKKKRETAHILHVAEVECRKCQETIDRRQQRFIY